MGVSTLSMTSPRGFSVAAINGRYHRFALNTFMAIVLLHWAEHLVQAYQVWVLDQPRPASRGVLGQVFPWLVSSEWLHYWYAVVMLAGLFLLRPGFAGRARVWWTVALAIQFWHHIEHLLLLTQAQTGTFYFGAAVPTSVAQVVFPRVELHLFYNSIVFVPMVVAVYLHLRPNARERAAATCACGSRDAAPSHAAPSRTPAPSG
jgi:hypothetical protein